MKIHTVRKYLAQLTTDPITNLAAHYKILNDAVCKNLGVRPVNNITLAVVGQDDEYTASVVSAALKHASISSATVNFDVTIFTRNRNYHKRRTASLRSYIAHHYGHSYRRALACL